MRRQWGALCIVLLFAAQILLRMQSSLNHDAAWYVYVAQELLNGKKLYADIIEVNPPLGMWLAVPPVWLAGLFNFSPITAYNFYLLLLTAMSLATSARYIPESDAAKRQMFLICIAAVLLFVPGSNFGQREHFVVLLFLPWLLLRLNPRENDSKLLRSLVGIAAAMAIALKPHAVFAPLLVETVLLFERRTLKSLTTVENIAALVFGFIYATGVAIFMPEYFSDIVPLGRAAYLPYYGFNFDGILLHALWWIFLSAIALLFWRERQARTVLAAAIGFGVSYFLQNKGFAYQILPATAFTVIAIACGAISTASLPLRGGAALAVAALLIAQPQIYRENRQIADRVKALGEASPQSIFVASNHLSHAFPYVVEQGDVWASRLPTQWLAPYVADHWKKGEDLSDPITQLALTWTIDDLENFKPTLVVVDESQEQADALGGEFTFLKFWANDPRFASLWQSYSLKSNADGIEIFKRN